MLPLQQAYEAKDAIIEYLKATFNFKDKEVNDAFYAFIQNDKYGIAHEPYISLKTPFTSADSDGSDVMEIYLRKEQQIAGSNQFKKLDDIPYKISVLFDAEF
jgi:hypothetical protein